MLEKIKKHACSVSVFVINLLLLGLGFLVIKDRDKARLQSVQEQTSTEIQPIEQSIISTQDQIAVDRENKLRDLNTAPKEVQQNQVTTNTTTKTTTPTTTTPATKKTKTS